MVVFNYKIMTMKYNIMCNNRAYLIFEKYNVRYGIRSRDIAHCMPPHY